MNIRAGILCSGFLGCAAVGAAAVVFHVSPVGNDGWSGRLPTSVAGRVDGPFRTLERARKAVRELRKSQGRAAQPITVRVHAGTYDLTRTLELGPADSGAGESAPVTWEAASDGEVVLRGGVPVRRWTPYRNGIFRTSLAGLVPPGHVFHQLFYRGVRQVLAREPNRDPAHPRTGGFAYVSSPGPRAREQFHLDPGLVKRVGAWTEAGQLEVSGMSGKGWTGICVPVRNLDPKTGLVTVSKIRYRFYRLNRLFFQNALGALDAPGEWFCNYKSGDLYFRPPDGRRPAPGSVVVPVLDTVIALRGGIPYPQQWLHVGFHGGRDAAKLPDNAPPEAAVRYITLRGFRIECARQSGVVLTGAETCRVLKCAVTNVGGVGINLGATENAYPDVGNPRTAPPKGVRIGVGGAGQDVYVQGPCRDCRIAGNDVWSVGADGIFLYGIGNAAENNHVYDSGLYDKDCAAINVFGEKNVVRRNSLHDVPRNAVFLKGIDNLIEANDIHHTMLETCDGGAVRMCQRNLKLRGNVIRRNRIVDTLGYGYPGGDNLYRAPYFSWGVYLDDFTCGTTVAGNLIVRAGRGGVHIHGGSDNQVAGNIIVDPGDYHVEINPIRSSPATGNRIERNLLVNRSGDAIIFKCGRWTDGLASFDWNFLDPHGKPPWFKLAGKRIEGLAAWRKRGFGEHSRMGAVAFKAPGRGDYRLDDPAVVAGLGIPPFPTDAVGCHPAAERRTWPLRNAALRQEKPFLYKAAPLPLADDFEKPGPGGKPVLGRPDIMAPRPSSIRVTAETAASGKRSLRFEDAPNLAHIWQPRLFYPLHWEDGRIRVAFALKLDAATRPELYVDLRQYRGVAGGRGYVSGIMLAVDAAGNVSVNGRALFRMPGDAWCRFELLLDLGNAADNGFDFRFEAPGQPSVKEHFRYATAKFAELDRLVIAATADRRTVFFLDDIRIERQAKRHEVHQ